MKPHDYTIRDDINCRLCPQYPFSNWMFKCMYFNCNKRKKALINYNDFERIESTNETPSIALTVTVSVTDWSYESLVRIQEINTFDSIQSDFETSAFAHTIHKSWKATSSEFMQKSLFCLLLLPARPIGYLIISNEMKLWLRYTQNSSASAKTKQLHCIMMRSGGK